MIDVNRDVIIGDFVRFSTIVDLMPYEGVGVVTNRTAYAARIKVENDPIILYVEVPLANVTPQISMDEAVSYCITALRLISVQDQGLGGTATLDQCWNSAKDIAMKTLSMMEKRNV